MSIERLGDATPIVATDAGAPASTSTAVARPRIAVGAGGEINMVADVVPSLRLFGDLAIERPGAFAPSLRVALARSAMLERRAAIGSADIAFTTASLDVCPLRLDFAAPVAVRPCAGFAGGVLNASGAGIPNPTSRTRPWLATTATGRLVWAAAPVLELELEAGAIFPLYRESFFFEPSVPIYKAPPAAFVGRFGLALYLR